MKVLSEISKLEPVHFEKVWGGVRLEKIFHADMTHIGESWIVSRHKEGPSAIGEIELNKVTSENELPYLVKLLDTSESLSVQVHPGDEYARKFENSFGKTECWYILDAKPGAGIYLGLKDGVSKGQLEESITSNDDVHHLLNFYPVKKGDFFFVPAGSIHAIGNDVFLVEVQQSSGITYRVWDWNRVDSQGNSRELHISKALDVINFEESFNLKSNFKFQSGIHEKEEVELINFEGFSAKIICNREKSELSAKGERCASLTCLEGTLKVFSKSNLDKITTVNQYESCIIPKGLNFGVLCESNSSFLFVS